MKTILFGITQGFAARYLLRTSILKTILDAGTVQAVILSPNSDEPYFRKEFSSCQLHSFKTEECKLYYANSRVRSFVLYLRKTVLNSKERIPFIDDKFDLWYDKNKRESTRSVWIRKNLSDILRTNRCLRKWLVQAESVLWKGHFHRDLFTKYRPDLTIVCSNGIFLPDALLLREAHYHRSKTMTVILSWDNPTSKGYGGAFPDYFVTWTIAMRQELIRYHDIPEERIFTGGIAHFDCYYDKPIRSRKKMCKSYGLDPARKILLLVTKSPQPFPNADIVAMLGNAIEKGEFCQPCQLVVRLHPNYFTHCKKNDIDEIEELACRYSHIRVIKPSVLSERLICDLPSSDASQLSEMLQYSDVMVNMFSTMVIEAAIFDLPIINIAFNGFQEQVQPPRRDIRIDQTQIHNQRILQTGGTRIAENRDEMVVHINSYLMDRSLDREGRKRIVANEAGPNGGHSGKIIAEYILRLLDLKR